MTDLFRYNDYKQYLNDKLDDVQAGLGRGGRTRLAEKVSCQTAYVAQVLRGKAHFSLEQGELINEFLSHTEDQAHFFLLLIQRQRAGLARLQKRFDSQIQAIREHRLELKNRLGVKSHLRPQDQAEYYSSWIYSAVHALASIPEFHAVEKIASHLNVEPAIVSPVLEYLLRTGLLQENPRNSKRPISAGVAKLHVPADSPFVVQHHLNWRMQSMKSIERRRKEPLHYSSIVSISAADAARVRELLVEAIKKSKDIIRESADEKLFSFCCDFFEV